MQTINYPFSDVLPVAGSAINLAPGFKWIRMPLPFALDHINLWLIRDFFEGKEGWTIVDCGVANEATKQFWEGIFATQLEGLPIVRVLVTHMHPDHLGLAAWLCRRWGVPLWMTMTDYLLAKWLISPAGVNQGSMVGGGGAADHFLRHGLSDSVEIEKIRARADYYSQMVPALPSEFRRLMGGDEIQIGEYSWSIVSGYGHSPEHACLWSRHHKIFISGDMVLPRISTNVSVFAMEPDADPLGLYLNSLETYLQLPDEALVLPSHGKPFRGLHGRIEGLKDHHRDRLAETMAACSDGAITARELVPILFKRELDLHQLTFAMGEAIAHLNHLWHEGLLRREVSSGGVMRFFC